MPNIRLLDSITGAPFLERTSPHKIPNQFGEVEQSITTCIKNISYQGEMFMYKNVELFENFDVMVTYI